MKKILFKSVYSSPKRKSATSRSMALFLGHERKKINVCTTGLVDRAPLATRGALPLNRKEMGYPHSSCAPPRPLNKQRNSARLAIYKTKIDYIEYPPTLYRKCAMWRDANTGPFDTFLGSSASLASRTRRSSRSTRSQLSMVVRRCRTPCRPGMVSLA
jgi:hypothetical protein